MRHGGMGRKQKRVGCRASIQVLIEDYSNRHTDSANHTHRTHVARQLRPLTDISVKTRGSGLLIDSGTLIEPERVGSIGRKEHRGHVGIGAGGRIHRLPRYVRFPDSSTVTGRTRRSGIATAYRACRRSPVRASAPFVTMSARSRVVVAGEAPVMRA